MQISEVDLSSQSSQSNESILVDKINNWKDLIEQSELQVENRFKEFHTKISRVVNSYKYDKSFDQSIVKVCHQGIFDNYKLLYEQLFIEDDVTDILTEVRSLDSNNTMIFNMVATGKWIKFHGKETSNITFIDDEKSIISDRTLADFLNRIGEYQNYRFFGNKPLIYYKFKTMPSDEIIDYIKEFGVIPILLNQKTNALQFDNTFSSKLLLDQATIITLCSNLSYGLSDSFYTVTKENKTKQQVLDNKLKMDSILSGKSLIVNQTTYDQTFTKMNITGGPTENLRFRELMKSVKVVPDDNCINPRFIHMKEKESEIICISVAEREVATMITNNKHVWRKTKMHYKEIPCEIFLSVQLSETKYI